MSTLEWQSAMYVPFWVIRAGSWQSGWATWGTNMTTLHYSTLLFHTVTPPSLYVAFLATTPRIDGETTSTNRDWSACHHFHITYAHIHKERVETLLLAPVQDTKTAAIPCTYVSLGEIMMGSVMQLYFSNKYCIPVHFWGRGGISSNYRMQWTALLHQLLPKAKGYPSLSNV